jgi:hypothetical protein
LSERRPDEQATSGICVSGRSRHIATACYGIYIQPINYPTVPKGSERLRITPNAGFPVLSSPTHKAIYALCFLTDLRESEQGCGGGLV